MLDYVYYTGKFQVQTDGSAARKLKYKQEAATCSCLEESSKYRWFFILIRKLSRV